MLLFVAKDCVGIMITSIKFLLKDFYIPNLKQLPTLLSLAYFWGISNSGQDICHHLFVLKLEIFFVIKREGPILCDSAGHCRAGSHCLGLI